MYQGKENYETWTVSLRLDNERGSRGHYVEVAEELRAMIGDTPEVIDGTWTEEEAVRYRLAEIIEADLEHDNPLTNDTIVVCPSCGKYFPHSPKSSLYTDLLTSALNAVDWDGVARVFIET